ncbi:CHAT domain-containing protein [Streptomyces sp. NBC_00280]|uniref:CHAT domain-containing protein n=1 Tax=Streptomyces sp. NBC_00280 TaxID=2975699 RepID=UPI00324DAEE3
MDEDEQARARAKEQLEARRASAPGPAGPFLKEYSPNGAQPQVSARTALVRFYRNGGYSVVTVTGTRHVDKPVLARPHTVCEIALGTYQTPLEMELPAAGSTSFFEAEVDIHWTVEDPHLVAVQVVTDIAKRLTGPLFQGLREVTSTYQVHEAEQANRAITRECAAGRWGELGTELGLNVRLYVRLRVDDRAIEHMNGIRHAHASAEVTRVHQERFRSMLQGGELEQLSYMLAAEPTQAKDFLEKIRQEGRQDERDRVDRLFDMVESGQIQSNDVEAQALDRLNQGRLGEVHGPLGSIADRRSGAPKPHAGEPTPGDPPSVDPVLGDVHQTQDPSSRRRPSTRTVLGDVHQTQDPPSPGVDCVHDWTWEDQDAEGDEPAGEFTTDYPPPGWYTRDAGAGPSKTISDPPPILPLDEASQHPSGQDLRKLAPRLPVGSGFAPSTDGGSTEPRSLVAELPGQTSPGREVPLHVQIVRIHQGSSERGVPLRSFSLPRDGARVLVTIHAPGLVIIDELQQELDVVPGRDSDVLLFRLKAPMPGLHQVTVRAFRGGTFLGEVICQISVGHGSVTRDGPQRQAALPSMAFDPGEVTLQVLKDEAAGTFSFQLISETFYPPEIFRFRGGDPRQATEQIYAELRKAARDAATGGGDGNALRRRLRSHGSQLWTSAVPQAVQSQFWAEAEAEHVKAFTVLGEQDVIPWELLYPLNEDREERGFLAEWLPVVRRVFGQDRVRSISLPGAAFVVPPGSPTDTGEEVASLRARLGAEVADFGVLTERAALTDLIESGHAGLLHFACHNAFTGAGSCVTMADGPFDPIDLTPAARLRPLRHHHPLVFFNACRSAGEIDWFGESLGWAPQFLKAGAGAFVGTLWPVRSRSALQFAEAFYEQLITHRQTLGQASLVARQTIRDLHGGDPTWLAYAVYGSPAATAHTTA